MSVVRSAWRGLPGGVTTPDNGKRHLLQLSPDQLAIQAAARWELYRYVDKIWDAPHLRSKGGHPNDDPSYQVVAGLRDLLDSLAVAADDAMGDDVHVTSVKMVVEREE